MPGRSGQGSSPVRRNETKSHAEERALAGVLLHFPLARESLDVTLAYLRTDSADTPILQLDDNPIAFVDPPRTAACHFPCTIGRWTFTRACGASGFAASAKSAALGQELVRRFAALRTFGPEDLGVFIRGRRDPGTFPIRGS